MGTAAIAASRRFQLVLSKPWHYHNDGYAAQWQSISIPSNAPAVTPTSAVDGGRRQLRRADLSIDIVVAIDVHADFGLVCLIRNAIGPISQNAGSCASVTSGKARSHLNERNPCTRSTSLEGGLPWRD
jgi:hypothetical protein